MMEIFDLFEPFIIVLLLLFGAVQLLLALSAARLPLRLWRLPERGAGQVHEEGAQLCGQLVSLGDPLHTLDGEPVVMLETALIWPNKRDIPLSDKRWGKLGVSDSTGTIEIDLDRVLLWRESRTARLDQERFRATFPEIWSGCNEWQQGALSFTVDQSYLPVGQTAFVAGRVMRDTHPPEAGYRGDVASKLVVGAGVGLPLVVACKPRSVVLGHLLAPAVRHVVAGLGAIVLALVVFGIDRWISAAAGL